MQPAPAGSEGEDRLQFPTDPNLLLASMAPPPPYPSSIPVQALRCLLMYLKAKWNPLGSFCTPAQPTTPATCSAMGVPGLHMQRHMVCAGRRPASQ